MDVWKGWAQGMLLLLFENSLRCWTKKTVLDKPAFPKLNKHRINEFNSLCTILEIQ